MLESATLAILAVAPWAKANVVSNITRQKCKYTPHVGLGRPHHEGRGDCLNPSTPHYRFADCYNTLYDTNVWHL